MPSKGTATSVGAANSQSTASIDSYSLALAFASESRGEPITFLDPMTSIDMALTGDGNGNWKATISCPRPGAKQYTSQAVAPGTSLSIVSFDGVSYSVQFSSQEGQDIREAIQATITGIPDSQH